MAEHRNADEQIAPFPGQTAHALAFCAQEFAYDGHSPGPMIISPEEPTREFPYTLDLRQRAG